MGTKLWVQGKGKVLPNWNLEVIYTYMYVQETHNSTAHSQLIYTCQAKTHKYIALGGTWWQYSFLDQNMTFVPNCVG